MKKFILLAVVAVMAVFACQKQDSFTPQTVKEGVVSSRSSVTPEELAQNENFKSFVNNTFRFVKYRGSKMSKLSSSEVNSLTMILKENSIEERKDEALRILGETEEALIYEASLVAIPFNKVLNDFPDLRTKSKDELNELVSQAGDLFIEEIQIWYRSIDGIIIADLIPDGYEHVIIFGCEFNWELANVDGTFYRCPNYETCHPVWAETIDAIWSETLNSAWDCVSAWLDLGDWITWGGFFGSLYTAPIGAGAGSATAIGATIGAAIGFAVNIPEAGVCLDMVDAAFSQDCQAAIDAANACCEW